MSAYETVIGLEVHLQLATNTKAFCGCSTKFGAEPNSHACPVCLGFPGSLPVLNEQAFLFSVKVALALDCKIQGLVKFDRKNYYYPDLPKNFQISQYDMPLSYNGSLEITVKDKTRKRIRIKRVHLEEDAGKLIHPEGKPYSLVDYNRSGIPLLEIVTEPDINSPDEAYEYLTKLKSILEYLRVSDCDMEKGSLRCDANISIRPRGANKLGTKVELKNMNTFKGVRSALEYEAKRQESILEDKGEIAQETRLWNAEKQITTSMRTKEEAQDYRYFPEPDLVPFVVDKDLIRQARESLPELPEAKLNRFVKDFGLSEYDAGVLISQIDIADYFEECAKGYPNRKTISNWITGEVMAVLNDKFIGIKDLKLLPRGLTELLKMIDEGAVSGKMAKAIFAEAAETGADPKEIAEKRGLSQISDRKLIEEMAERVIKREMKTVNDYRAGKSNALAFLIGQIMKESRGKANPALASEILKSKLGGG
ncbi:MAG: Asp-tRNA(Asn)/Glu-tRNA(Gln) amidotransferase subunit GatB [Candidatus Omnitrophica bacterium]|nr:Asp-tRNA(Asn)/Glu-tRNA(Gln) amidotransferase subunit GatB [Candidatus Omnitrophota bacterium]